MNNFMKSFTQNLVITFTGVIFAGFLTVYFLFNALVDNHIRTEAENELAIGIVNVAGRVINIGGNEPFINMQTMDDGRFIFHIQQLEMPQPTIRRSIISADVILIGANDDIIMPMLGHIDTYRYEEINLLSNHYITNRTLFENEEMVLFTASGRTYYLKAVSQAMMGEDMTILMYTDVSSVIAFRDSMNQRLFILLAISGLFGLLISVVLSKRFKHSIERLGAYANKIGHGKFNENVGTFKYSEFESLSKSMTAMAEMLQSYENNQKQFFQNVSHELRTPLMSIQGYAEGLITDVFEKEEASHIILGESEKMAELVRRLLYMSRYDSGLETTNNFSSINVQNLLYDCHERVKIIAEKSSKNIEVSATDAVVTSDAEKLEMAIINLLTNAIRHAKSTVELLCKTSDEGWLEIIVKDDGDGICETDLPHIFERFYKGSGGNSGLGLTIVENVVSDLGGKITAENLPQGGAQFTIHLSLS